MRFEALTSWAFLRGSGPRRLYSAFYSTIYSILHTILLTILYERSAALNLRAPLPGAPFRCFAAQELLRLPKGLPVGPLLRSQPGRPP